MKKESREDIALRRLTRANEAAQRLFSRPVRWLLAAILFTAIAHWFWSPLWNGASHQFGGGHWVQDLRRGGSRMSGGEGIVLGIAVTLFAVWSWMQVFRTSWTVLRGPKK
jgi:hypothetical protein